MGISYEVDPRTIRQIDSIETLEVMHDALDVEIAHIEAQLEFMAEGQTIEWENRATAALAYKRVQRSAVARRLKKLREPEEKLAEAEAVVSLRAKITEMKAAEKLEAREAQLETQRLAVERERLKQERIQREDYYFGIAAKKYLTPDQVIECGTYARHMVSKEFDVMEAAQ